MVAVEATRNLPRRCCRPRGPTNAWCRLDLKSFCNLGGQLATGRWTIWCVSTVSRIRKRDARPALCRTNNSHGFRSEKHSRSQSEPAERVDREIAGRQRLDRRILPPRPSIPPSRWGENTRLRPAPRGARGRAQRPVVRACRPITACGPSLRVAVRIAALLHEIGNFVSDAAIIKHSMYLILQQRFVRARTQETSAHRVGGALSPP